jgi:hypothetical protein
VLNWPFHIDDLKHKISSGEFRGAYFPHGECWSSNWPFADDQGYRASEIIDWIDQERSEAIRRERARIDAERSWVQYRILAFQSVS